MTTLIDLSGQQYGNLFVVERCVENTKQNKPMWLCKCTCGKIVSVNGNSLRRGKTRSCGCLQKSIVTRHGKRYTSIYNIWRNMKARCYNENNISYKYYGARGIRVCDEWINSFESFYKWSINNGYNNGLTIDRLNNNKNYEPNNCRWVNMTEQQNNRRNNRLITYTGETKTLSQWASLYGIKVVTLSQRLKHNWDIEEALTTPVDDGGVF